MELSMGKISGPRKPNLSILVSDAAADSEKTEHAKTPARPAAKRRENIVLNLYIAGQTCHHASREASLFRGFPAKAAKPTKRGYLLARGRLLPHIEKYFLRNMIALFEKCARAE